VDVFSGVCLSVCLFVCQHDNFRTIKRKMTNLAVRCTVQKSRSSSSVKVKGRRPRSRGQKKEKVRHFVQESSSGARSLCGSFFGSGPRRSKWCLVSHCCQNHLSSFDVGFSCLQTDDS